MAQHGAVSVGAYFLAAVIGPFFWWIMLGTCLWIVRRLFPKWEKVLWQKIPND